jgi:hypothetical protein
MKLVEISTLASARPAILLDQLRSAMLNPIGTDEAMAHEASETCKHRPVPKVMAHGLELLTSLDGHLVPVAISVGALLAAFLAKAVGQPSTATGLLIIGVGSLLMAAGMRGLTLILDGVGIEVHYGPATWVEYEGIDTIRTSSPAHKVCLDVMSRPQLRDAFECGRLRIIERRLERKGVTLDPTVWIEDLVTKQRACILIYDGGATIRSAL